MEAHRHAQHRRVGLLSGRTPPPIPHAISGLLSRAAGSEEFPVEGCGGRASTCTNLQIYSVQRHVQDTIVIMEEGNHPHPLCPTCDMFVP